MFLFVTVPNNSASTMIMRILGTSPNISYLSKDIWFDRPNPPNTGSVDFEGKDVRLADRSDYVSNYMPKSEPRVFSENAEAYCSENYNWDMIKKFWFKSWDMSKPVQIEKTPDNVYKAQEIAKQFPDAKFIISTREAEGFCASMKKYGYPVKRSYQHWLACQKKQEENAAVLRGRCYVTTYEQICADPQKFIDDLLKFVPELSSLKIPEFIESLSEPCYELKAMRNEI